MQRLVLVRHGHAQDAEDGLSDMARALTDKGRKKARKAARGLAGLCGGVDLLVSSPLLRALQTADILDEQLNVARREEVDWLSPMSDPAAALTWAASRDEELIMLVGHEPHLNRTVGLALTGEPQSMLEFKKSAAAMLEFDDRAEPGAGRLRWFLAPSQLGRHPLDADAG
ncbi:MAG: phosphohistidine phosphatase SixA [Ectothiorhodospiraceae bacterium]|nr:phosphohistidine phosphatase SixA [Ectothiorhodospiraceae bacterium]MCH8503665.1 phosphohistidine phosphatase SixA [Ectothiorhodospiraceae bacterium]